MLEFIDTHFHLWDLNHKDLAYAWLEEGAEHPQLGPRLAELGKENYLIADFISETRTSNVSKAIHVQAAIGSLDPIKETEWLQSISDMTGFPNAIVAYANLSDPNVEAQLERHSEYPALRGIRDMSEGDYLTSSRFQHGYDLLAKFNLVSSLDCYWENMDKASDLAAKCSNVVMVLDHCGFPQERSDEYFRNWARGINTIAEKENVICKISGLGMVDHNWTIESIRPWVLHCIDAFGTDRCIFGSNWPVDKLFSNYEKLINAYTKIIQNFRHGEKVAMFSDNANRIYQI